MGGAEMEVDIQTLQEKYPAQFQKEYEDWSQHALDYPWWDTVYEQWIEKLEKIGISTDKDSIQFSGFWSQGDGASFTGSINVSKFCGHYGWDNYLPVSEAYKWGLMGTCMLTRSDHHYSHENTVGLDLGAYGYINYDEAEVGGGVFAGLTNEELFQLADPLMESFESALLSTCRNLMRDLYHDLEYEYEYLTSEESFIESCVCNEVTFDVEVEDESET